MANIRRRRTISVNVDVDVDISDIDTEDLVSELKSRGEIANAIPNETLLDKLKKEFIANNWDKITLEKLENCIK